MSYDNINWARVTRTCDSPFAEAGCGPNKEGILAILCAVFASLMVFATIFALTFRNNGVALVTTILIGILAYCTVHFARAAKAHEFVPAAAQTLWIDQGNTLPDSFDISTDEGEGQIMNWLHANRPLIWKRAVALSKM